jgi:serine/threonine-protein kinase RsbW
MTRVMNTAPRLRSFPRMIESLDHVFEFLRAFAVQNSVEEKDSFPVNVAVEEAFVNMVRHSPQSQRDVSISLEIADGRLVVILVDQDVEPFDLTKAPDVDVRLPLYERRVGGLGVFLIRGLMDDVRYEYCERTSTLTLIKNLEPRDV